MAACIIETYFVFRDKLEIRRRARYEQRGIDTPYITSLNRFPFSKEVLDKVIYRPEDM